MLLVYHACGTMQFMTSKKFPGKEKPRCLADTGVNFHLKESYMKKLATAITSEKSI